MSSNMSRWEPIRDMELLMSRLAPYSVSRWPLLGSDVERGHAYDWSPSADISESEGEYLIRASLPAVAKDDIHVTVADGVITIQGERRQREEQKGEKLHRVESYFGRFMRSFSLPTNANLDAIRCDSKEGVLTVHVPKLATQLTSERKVKVE